MNNNEQFDLQVNMNFFIKSLNELVNLLFLKSKEENIEILDSNLRLHKCKCEQHMKLRESCAILKNGFVEENQTFDKGRIIKKVYKTITEHIDLIYPEKNDIFFIKDKNNNIITIIPGTDIGLIVNKLTPEENKLLWGHLYMMYISAANMICNVNKQEKIGKIWEIIPKLREKIVEYYQKAINNIPNTFLAKDYDNYLKDQNLQVTK